MGHFSPRAFAADEEDDVLPIPQQRRRIEHRLEPVLDPEEARVHDHEAVAERVLGRDLVLAWERPEELDVRPVRKQPPLIHAHAPLGDGVLEGLGRAGDHVCRAVHPALDQAQHPDCERAFLGSTHRHHLVRPEVA